jgi:hypothetical protein
MKFIFCFIILIIQILVIIGKPRSTKTKTHRKRLRKNFKGSISVSDQQDGLKNILKSVFIQEKQTLSSYGAIYKNKKGKFLLANKKLDSNHLSLVAECHFHKTINQKGWDKISINTYKTAGPYQQAYFAGYLEGRMTSEDIYHFYNNLRANNQGKHKKSYAKMYDFFTKVAESFGKRVIKMKNQANSMSYEDRKFWSRIILAWTQLEGLIKGYTFETTRKGLLNQRKLTIADFLILQADGEVPELLRYFHSQPAIKNHVKMGDVNYFKDAFGINTKDPITFWKQLMWTSKCSAFIKLTKDSNGKWEDLLAGHTTWTEYYEMLRTYKQ